MLPGSGGSISSTSGGASGAQGGASAAAGGSAPTNSGGTTTEGGAGGAPTGGAAQGGSASGSGGGPSSGGGGGNGGTSAGSAGMGGSGAASDDAIAALRAHLALERAARPPLDEQPFASVPLDEQSAEIARELLWEDHVAFVRETRRAEVDANAITIGDKTLRYDARVFGAKPAAGRSLYVSLHGGGEAAPSVNDQQWENQKTLYQPDEGIYLAPRAPTNTWNLWHEAHIDGLLRRLVEALIVFEDVNPNRVYLMGYSAGGDGVYQLAPRMADSWAAAAMMAGHPNDAKPDGLRNIGFTLHVGALDTAFDRNLVAQEWGELLDALRAADPEGYVHEVRIHAGKGHWMDLEDAVAVPWMAQFTRDPAPSRVVWLQDDVPHERFYWLAVPSDQATKGTKVVATRTGQTIRVEAEGVRTLLVRLSDALVDLDQPVTIEAGSTTLFSGPVFRTIGTLAKTLAERGDPALVYSAEVTVEL